MSEYVDTKLINCNRLASVESRTGNDSNPAVFTNPLNETIRLDVGDKISVERAFVSEIGAGNPQTIEYKGLATGNNPVATHTDIVYGDYFYNKSTTHDPNYRLGYYRSITTTLKVKHNPPLPTDEFVDLRDNLAPLIFGYYITSNEYPNYIQQPRRFAQNADTRGLVGSNYSYYKSNDSTGFGATFFTTNTNAPCLADWIKPQFGGIIYKQKCDNTRFSLFIKDKIAYSATVTNAKEQFPKQFHNGIFSECNYLRIRERKDIEIKKGFNTPSAVASQISQQLTETRNEQIFEIKDGNGFLRPITKTIETTTYKPINAQNLYNFCTQTLAGYVAQDLADGVAPSQLAVDYIATFGYIGVKRPEIFEKGREMAALETVVIRNNTGAVIVDQLLPHEGFQIVEARGIPDPAVATNQSTLFVTNIEYTEENCKRLREFFDTQALYPELWDQLEETIYYSDVNVDIINFPDNFGNQRPTINNSRIFHMNKYTTTNTINPHNETFGDDAFTQRVAPNDIETSSVPWFQYYDDNFRDTFIPPNQWASIFRDGVSYGFATPHKYQNYNDDGTVPDEPLYLIAIQNYNVAGTPADLFSSAGKTIEIGRRFGYDFHSTAYGTAIVTPYAGYSNMDIGTLSTTNNNPGTIITCSDTCNHIQDFGTTSGSTTDLMPYMTQTYVGANNPEISYNGVNNRFEFKRLHTSNNIGNKFKAGAGAASIVSKAFTPPNGLGFRDLTPPTKNAEAGTTVYKINPRPVQFGYSPTFKPYNTNNFAQRSNVYPETASTMVAGGQKDNTQIYNAWNINISPYTVFDSHGGIYIDNWGFDEDNWVDNFWDILGFEYDSVNAPASTKNVLTKRVNNDNSSALYRPTTNAEVVSTDTKAYVTNQYGASQYTTSVPYPSCVIDYHAVAGPPNDIFLFKGANKDNGYLQNAVTAQPLEIFDEVSIQTESTSITATNIQKSVLRPYYTIRSDILEGATAIGGNPTGANLPIISIVDKYSGASDYFLGNPSDLQFTVTKPTVIADITTSIHDSDGRYANVDRTSAVIYKVEKIKRTPIGLIEQMLEDNAKGQKKKK